MYIGLIQFSGPMQHFYSVKKFANMHTCITLCNLFAVINNVGPKRILKTWQNNLIKYIC